MTPQGSTPGSTQPARLMQAAIALSSERELEAVLARIVSEARSVASARYAAMAIYDEAGSLWRFVHDGLDEGQTAAIASCPTGQGLIATVAASDAPVRIEDIAADPRAEGFPAGHPPMSRLMGAPVATGRRRYGSLYLCDRVDGAPFDTNDEAEVEVFAQLGAAAVERALIVRNERQRTEALAAVAAAEAREGAQRQILGQVIAAQEAERARVSRDLHDEIGQALTSVLLAMRVLEDATTESLSGQLDQVRALVTGALESVRSLAFELRPTVLDDLGLFAALDRLACEAGGRSGLHVAVSLHGLDEQVRLGPDVETVVYRVIQEALTNVVRHARAATTTIQVLVDSGRVRALVEDDGAGFDPSRHHQSMGLTGMRERATLAGGTLVVESSPGVGTTVVLDVPVG